MDPIAALAGAASVALTGLVKRGLGSLDSRVAEVYKPVQPWIALGLSIGLPILAQHTGIALNPDVLMQAPASTLAFLGARELYAKVATPKGKP